LRIARDPKGHAHTRNVQRNETMMLKLSKEAGRRVAAYGAQKCDLL
jgi:hypothetical protein